jgi:predicted lipid carrier protein YhbT
MAGLLATAALLLAPLATLAQTSGSTSDKWIHVRVISNEDQGASVKVNVPLDMAEEVLPAINRDNLHDGKITIDSAKMNGVDVRAILNAVRTAKDGEFVTVQAPDADVRVAKEGGFLLIHVVNKAEGHHHAAKTEGPGKGQKMVMISAHPQHVEIRVPMKVVDALFSGPKDQLDVLAALRALSASGDTELVSVKSDDNTVRVWIDSKNIAE